ncbi:Fe-S cluster assembly protein SufD [Alphaproteobacteria bacterium]|nr:Fe-S cluster assembly protein SufD [Alphaproteobacteria bacterium]
MPASMTLPDLSAVSPKGAIRTAALANWHAAGWPGPKAEAWRYTALSALQTRTLVPASPESVAPDYGASDGAAMGGSIGAHMIRFVNGIIDPAAFSDVPQGLTFTALGDDEGALAALQEMAPHGHPISDLSLAVMSAGICIDVSGKVETPLMLVFEGDDASLSAHPVILLRMANGSGLQLAEWHQSSVGLAAPLIGFDIGDEARLEQVKIQCESANTTHLSATGVRLGKGASIAGFAISVGSALARLETHVALLGEGGDCQLSAIYMGRGTQHQDITTYMDHAVAGCTSNQIIRGVLDDRSRGVYQGRVHVAPDAQKTDGQQMSRALLLSRKAEADAKPELEIYADDVVCAHGATVGELDATQLFYLTSRGIPREAARAMLIEAFLIDTIETVENKTLAGLLRPVAEAWLAEMWTEMGQNNG